MSYSALVEYSVKGLVENPDKVQVDEVQEEGSVQIQVRVAPDDAGKVIGRNGRLVSAIRQVVSVAAAKNNDKAYVKVVTD